MSKLGDIPGIEVEAVVSTASTFIVYNIRIKCIDRTHQWGVPDGKALEDTFDYNVLLQTIRVSLEKHIENRNHALTF